MKMNLEEVLAKVTDFIENEANTDTVVGKQFQLGEFHIVPVIRIGMGFGSGAGEGEASKQGHGEGGAAAGGLGIEPLGFLATRKEQISFIPTQSSKGLSAAFEKAPDLIEKYLESQKKEEMVTS